MSESSLSVIDYENNEQESSFLRSYVVDNNEHNALAKDNQKSALT